jgi:hypothetical protein
MSRVATHPAATVEIINALRSEYPAAIGAHMIGSCVNAVVDDGPSSLTRSRRCADDAIKTLNAVEEHFPGLHRKTLASVLNNRAVLSIRQGNIMGAANYLNQAANLLPDELPFAVYHNASMLLNSEVELGNSRTKLAITVAKGRPQSAEQVPGYLVGGQKTAARIYRVQERNRSQTISFRTEACARLSTPQGPTRSFSRRIECCGKHRC